MNKFAAMYKQSDHKMHKTEQKADMQDNSVHVHYNTKEPAVASKCNMASRVLSCYISTRFATVQ